MLDTNVIIRFLGGDTRAKELLDNAENISVSAIVVGELQYGAQKSSQTQSNLLLFSSFLSDFPIVPIDKEIAMMYGEVKEQLRKKGFSIPENDIWIAASAKAMGYALISFDAHFEHVESLELKR